MGPDHSHAKHNIAMNIRVLSRGFWNKNAVVCAGAMPFHRDFPATTRILSFQAKNCMILPTILFLKTALRFFWSPAIPSPTFWDKTPIHTPVPWHVTEISVDYQYPAYRASMSETQAQSSLSHLGVVVVKAVVHMVCACVVMVRPPRGMRE